MKTKEKLTIQDFLDMSLDKLKKLTINEFVELCSKNDLDFAEVIKQIKYKFDVQDQEMQNKQTIYSNLKDNIAIVQKDENEVSCDEYLQIQKLCAGNEQQEKFIVECLQSGLTMSKLQRYFSIGFNKAARLVDSMVFEKILIRTETKYEVINNQAFIQKVCSPYFLDI